jgi:uncharacterized protein (DUF305 family)
MPTDSELSLDQLIELERRAAEREAAAGGGTPGDGSGGLAGDTEQGDYIVLPWWQRPFNIALIAVTAAILAGMIGWMIGDNGGRPAHNEVDVGFLHDMREHHEQAVYMSLIYRELQGTSPGLGTVALTIVRGQDIEVGRMIQLLRSFAESEVRDDGAAMDWMGDGGHGTHTAGTAVPTTDDFGISEMPGMATEAELDALAAASGAEADRLFVELMSAHHTAGVEMAAYAAEHAANDEVTAMAESIVRGQQAEIAEMQQLLES